MIRHLSTNFGINSSMQEYLLLVNKLTLKNIQCIICLYFYTLITVQLGMNLHKIC